MEEVERCGDGDFQLPAMLGRVEQGEGSVLRRELARGVDVVAAALRARSRALVQRAVAGVRRRRFQSGVDRFSEGARGEVSRGRLAEAEGRLPGHQGFAGACDMRELQHAVGGVRVVELSAVGCRADLRQLWRHGVARDHCG